MRSTDFVYSYIQFMITFKFADEFYNQYLIRTDMWLNLRKRIGRV